MLESAWLPLAADGIVATLLVVTIIYVVRLNNRLTALRADRAVLAELITGLQKAAKQAEDAVIGLKLSAAESGRELAEKMERCGSLRDDLKFLIGKAETMVDRLEGGVRGRKETAAPAKQTLSEKVAPEPQSSKTRLASLLRQAASNERHEPEIRVAASVGSAAGELEAAGRSRQSRSEQELQRALMGR